MIAAAGWGADKDPLLSFVAEAERDPLFFGREILGRARWPRQEEIRLSVKDHRRTIVISANGCGKTFELGSIAVEWLVMHPMGRVICVGPTGDQVRDGVWSEIKRAFHAATARGHPPGGVIGEKVWRIEDGWEARIVSVDNVSAAQGKHAQGAVLVIVDEGQGVEAVGIFDALDSCMQGEEDRLIVCGNPLAPQGFFYEASQDPDHYNVIWIDGFEHPNIDSPPDTIPTKEWADAGQVVIPGSITRRWMLEKWEMWGPNDPRWRARCRGRFPRAGAFQLIPPEVLDLCADLIPDVDEHPRAGLDCARNTGAGDRNVITIFDRHRRVIWAEGWHSDDLMAVAGHFIARLREFGWTEEDAMHAGVDVGGLGSGVVDKLREQEWMVTPVDFGSAATKEWAGVIGEEANHIYLKPELYDVLGSLFRLKLISVPREWRNTWADLKEVRFKHDGSGRMKIEDKESVRVRIGRSPDFADSVVIALAASGYVPEVLHVRAA